MTGSCINRSSYINIETCRSIDHRRHIIVMMHCCNRNKLTVNVWQSGGNSRFGAVVCETVSVSVCVCALVGVHVSGRLGDISCSTFTVRGWEALSCRGLCGCQGGSGSGGSSVCVGWSAQ